jgi:hypothetical protein
MPGFIIEGSEKESVKINKDIKRAHRWRIFKFGPAGAIGTDDLLFAKSVTMPTIAFEEHNVLGGSIPYKFATRPAFGDLVVAFYDLIGLEPKVRSWQNKVWDPQKGIGMANDYKDTVILYLTDGKGEQSDNAWKFINAWPKVINHGELLYDSSEFKLLTVTISYDWIEYPNTGDIAVASTASRVASWGN